MLVSKVGVNAYPQEINVGSYINRTMSHMHFVHRN